MTKVITIRGKWFLPSNVELEVPGSLTYNPDKGIYLEVEDLFHVQEETSKREIDKADIILGVSQDGESITLLSCFVAGTQLGYSYKVTWYANEMFIGCHALKASDLFFDEIVLQVHPLFLWLNSSGIEFVNSEKPSQSTTFSYTKPDNIPFLIDDRTVGEFRFHSSFTYPTSYSEGIEFHQSAVVAIKTLENIDLGESDLWLYAQRFMNWLTVITGYPCEIEEIKYYHKNLIAFELENGTKIRQEVIKYAKKQQVTRKPDSPSQFLFDFPTISRYIPDALTRWFALYESIEVVIQILAENMGRDIAFSEFHFKDIVQALEAFHRKRIRNERMSDTDYKSYMNRVLSQIIDETDRSFVQDRLKYGNEPSLKNRLDELIECHNIPSLQAIIGKKKSFVRMVIDNRNYHTHLDSNGKTILTPTGLYHLTEKALALLFTNIIVEVIPDKEFINQILISSKRWGFWVRRDSYN